MRSEATSPRDEACRSRMDPAPAANAPLELSDAYFATRFGWRTKGVSVRAMERSRLKAYGSRFREGIATSVK